MEQQPTLAVLFKRNMMMLLFPVEGAVILRDSYARRLADKWWGTIVINDRNALRGTLRILLGNIILVGFFNRCFRSVLELRKLQFFKQQNRLFSPMKNCPFWKSTLRLRILKCIWTCEMPAVLQWFVPE